VIWLSWRQQRTETLIAAAILVVLAAAFVPAGIHAADLFTQEHLGLCINRSSQACLFAVGNFANRGGFVRSLLAGGWLNLMPGLTGVALAAPLLLDLENGTTRLAWTQSVTRRRWLATKASIAAGTVVLAGVAYALLFTWYQRPFDRIWGRWDQFGFEGVVPIAYVLFAFGLALAIGVLLRRSAAALVVAFGAYVGARLFVQSWLRQRFASPLSATWAAAQHGPPGGHGPNLLRAWVLFDGPSNRAGHPFSNFGLLSSCPGIGGGNKSSVPQPVTPDPHCMRRIGAGFNHAVWQPASRFWEFQGIETALFGGVALLLIAFATWRVLRAD
jgi:hypothetical protein